ncbi:hypothetical protein Caci_8811 [Catenulispora acidiphila DSM 44928]|uniref:DUF3558 domain-containing protein n=1 Tax=Catenulispora acidiphila (strain DSM 44928 / JCM 14897 / NBRC 102108 / NRRL B-24433 / ID139908) TaxID=479433 RepID=C7Q287_CATAD|nr:DUF3558 domain-containing protein [Catenulispora acidiphila]ACU77624.1 hypothetical protein Caci_8811 [Catenulispora acidiphila DSM 44928]
MPSPRPATIVAIAALALTVSATSSACGGDSTPPPLAPVATGSTSAGGATASAQGFVVPGVPDPCALLSADQVVQIAHLPDGVKSGAIASTSGGRSCAYNAGHPDTVTISLTAVTKSGFDAFRATIPAGTVTAIPNLGDEAYRSTQTPGVIDVYKHGFDLNIAVIHADSYASATDDAKAVALAAVGKV